MENIRSPRRDGNQIIVRSRTTAMHYVTWVLQAVFITVLLCLPVAAFESRPTPTREDYVSAALLGIVFGAFALLFLVSVLFKSLGRELVTVSGRTLALEGQILNVRVRRRTVDLDSLRAIGAVESPAGRGGRRLGAFIRNDRDRYWFWSELSRQSAEKLLSELATVLRNQGASIDLEIGWKPE